MGALEDAPYPDGHRLGGWKFYQEYSYQQLAYRYCVEAHCTCGQKLGSNRVVPDEVLYVIKEDQGFNGIFQFVLDLMMDIIVKHSSIKYIETTVQEAENVLYKAMATGQTTGQNDYEFAVSIAADAVASGKGGVVSGNSLLYGEWLSPADTGSDASMLAHESKKLPGVGYVTNCPLVEITRPEYPNGECGFTYSTIYQIIQHLNDKHKWTREAIADWLEEIHDPTGENGPNINFEMEESQ